jgi:hypothetical protein
MAKRTAGPALASGDGNEDMENQTQRVDDASDADDEDMGFQAQPANDADDEYADGQTYSNSDNDVDESDVDSRFTPSMPKLVENLFKPQAYGKPLTQTFRHRNVPLRPKTRIRRGRPLTGFPGFDTQATWVPSAPPTLLAPQYPRCRQENEAVASVVELVSTGDGWDADDDLDAVKQASLKVIYEVSDASLVLASLLIVPV